jgi:hypothetical protein
MRTPIVKRILSTILLAATAVGLSAGDVSAQQKRAQTVMKFLSTPISARASGMGDALTSVEGGVHSVYYNPSATAWVRNNGEVLFGNISWIADIEYQYAAAVIAPNNGLYGVFGFSALSVDYGDFTETVANIDQPLGYDILGTYSPSVTAFGMTYARALSNQFSMGAGVRFINQNLAPNAILRRDGAGGYERSSVRTETYAVDFGVFYRTGFKSLNLAMALRNYGPEVTYELDGQELPLTFRMGLSMDAVDFLPIDPKKHRLLLSVDANRPRDFREQIMFGTEYQFLGRLALRGGMVLPAEEQSYSFGAGVIQPIGRRYGIRADYSYTAFGVFDNVNRIAVQLTF